MSIDSDMRSEVLAHALRQGHIQWVSQEADWLAMQSGIDTSHIMRSFTEGGDRSYLSSKRDPQSSRGSI